MPDNNEFARSIDDATARIISDMKQKMNRACLVVEASAKRECPVDQGILRASITSEVEMSTSEITGRIGSNLEYAPYVHNGTGIYAKNGDGRRTPWVYNAAAGRYRGFHCTKGQRPQPFLEDAKIRNKAAIERILGG